MTIEDEVSYENLATGREYTVTGTLMDSETGEPLTDADGNAVTASTTFEPEKTEGKVKVTFSVDTSTLSNKKLVVFEKLEADGDVIARHEDPTDEGQTVEVIPPEIKTSAADGADGDKEVTADARPQSSTPSSTPASSRAPNTNSRAPSWTSRPERH